MCDLIFKKILLKINMQRNADGKMVEDARFKCPMGKITLLVIIPMKRYDHLSRSLYSIALHPA